MTSRVSPMAIAISRISDSVSIIMNEIGNINMYMNAIPSAVERNAVRYSTNEHLRGLLRSLDASAAAPVATPVAAPAPAPAARTPVAPRTPNWNTTILPGYGEHPIQRLRNPNTRIGGRSSRRSTARKQRK